MVLPAKFKDACKPYSVMLSIFVLYSVSIYRYVCTSIFTFLHVNCTVIVDDNFPCTMIR